MGNSEDVKTLAERDLETLIAPPLGLGVSAELLWVLSSSARSAISDFHREISFQTVLYHLLSQRRLPLLSEFPSVDVEGLRSCALAEMGDLPRGRAEAQTLPLASDVREHLQNAVNEARIIHNAEPSLSDLLWVFLDEIRSNPTRVRLRKAARIPEKQSRIDRSKLFPYETALSLSRLALGAAFAFGGFVFFVLGHPSQTAEFALPFGRFYSTVGGFLMCASLPLMMVRGGPNEFLLFEVGPRQGDFALPVAFLVGGLIVSPLIIAVVLYEPPRTDFAGLVVTKRGWSQTLEAFGAYEGMIAGMFAFEKSPSLKATFQRVVAAISAFAIALSLVIERMAV